MTAQPDRPDPVPVGRAWDQRYHYRSRMHALEPNPDAGTQTTPPWRLVCTGSRGAYQYAGWPTAVTCPDCQDALRLLRAGPLPPKE